MEPEMTPSEVAHRFLADRDYDTFATYLTALREATPKGVGTHWRQWHSDAAMLMGRWEEAWEIGARRTPNLIRTIGAKIGTSLRLSAEDVFMLIRHQVFTDWAMRNSGKFWPALEDLVNTLHDEAGKNFIDDLCDRYEPLMGALDEAAIEELLDALDSGTDNNDFLLLRAQLHRPENQTRSSARGKAQLYPFNTTPFGEGDGEFTEAVIEMEGLSWFTEFAIEGRARWIVREAENLARERAGVPRIGDGWVAESELHQLITEAFPEVRVEKHARPRWLRPQHLDVFLPEFLIGVEYQGEQHFKAIGFFGGEAGYAATVERDVRKRMACAEAGCLLIEIRKGDDQLALLERLRDEIVARGGKVA